MEQAAPTRRPVRPLPGIVQLILALVGLVGIAGFQAYRFMQDQVSETIPAVDLQRGDTVLLWGWNSGTSKPMVKVGGVEIIDVSGWESTIDINGRGPRGLWHHYLGANTAGDTLYASYYSYNEYLLEQEVQFESPERIHLRYFLTPYVQVNTARLRLGHIKWRWDEAAVVNGTFQASFEEAQVSVEPGQGLERAAIGEDKEGPYRYDAYYTASNIGQRTLIAEETITVGKRSS